MRQFVSLKASWRVDGADRQIHHAAQHPVELDNSQASAVEARIVLDLRIGAAFTRMQTRTLQPIFQQITGVVSYGECYSNVLPAHLIVRLQAHVNFLPWASLCPVLTKFRHLCQRNFGISTWPCVTTRVGTKKKHLLRGAGVIFLIFLWPMQFTKEYLRTTRHV